MQKWGTVFIQSKLFENNQEWAEYHEIYYLFLDFLVFLLSLCSFPSSSFSLLLSLKEMTIRGCVTDKEVTLYKLPAKPASLPPPAIKHIIALQM